MVRFVLPLLVLLSASPAHAIIWRDCQRAVLWAVTAGYDLGAPPPPYQMVDVPIDFARVARGPADETTPLRDPGYRRWRVPRENIQEVLEKSLRTALQFVDPATPPSHWGSEQDALFGFPTGWEDNAVVQAQCQLKRTLNGEDSQAFANLVGGQAVRLIRFDDVGLKRVGLTVFLERQLDGSYVLGFGRAANRPSEYLWRRLQRDVFSNESPVPMAVFPLMSTVTPEGMTLDGLCLRMQTAIQESLRSTLAFDYQAVEQRAMVRLRNEAIRAFFEYSVPDHPFKRIVVARLQGSAAKPSNLAQLLAFIDDTPGWTFWGRYKAESKRLTTETWRGKFYEWKLNWPIALVVTAESADAVKVTVTGKIAANTIRLGADGSLDLTGVRIHGGEQLRLEVEPQTPLAQRQPSLLQVQTFAVRLNEELGGF